VDHSDLTDVGTELLEEARAGSAQRAARTLCGGSGHVLRQTAIGIVGGASLSEHESPGEATLQVLAGRVRLTWSGEPVDLAAGSHVVIPPERHALLALDDSVVLLTTAMSEA